MHFMIRYRNVFAVLKSFLPAPEQRQSYLVHPQAEEEQGMSRLDSDEKPEAIDRRVFLGIASGGSAGALAAFVSAPVEAAAARPEADNNHAGYVETAHVRAYYASARY
jgi:hypothetical protein